ncbi:MAG: hypothetical protein MJZ24_09275, partial [Paludibacteraceae bacterium]|nr:hypothetical protein [Paludibacteraceae bacterium]
IAKIILEKWKFLAKTPWKSGKNRENHPGKVEIFSKNTLEKWKKTPKFALKNRRKHLGKVGKSRTMSLKKTKQANQQQHSKQL